MNYLRQNSCVPGNGGVYRLNGRLLHLGRIQLDKSLRYSYNASSMVFSLLLKPGSMDASAGIGGDVAR